MAAAARHSTNRLPALLSKTGSGAQLEATSQSAASPKNPFALSESMGESSSLQHACLEAVKSRRGGDAAAGGAAKRQRSVCPHSRKRSTCKECGGASICQHQRIRRRCKECREEADESMPDGLEEL